MNVILPDATAHNSKQLAIQKDMTPSLYAMFFKVTYNGSRLGEVGDLKAQSLKLLLMLIKSTNVQ